jgi:hypothetical protein
MPEDAIQPDRSDRSDAKRKPRGNRQTALVSTRKPLSALQAWPKKYRKMGTPLASNTRMRFLQAYERTFGNVTESCAHAGIARQTYYRWLRSPTEINRKFRERLDLLKPEEARIDFLEAAHTELVKRGDAAAIIFGLKTQGRKRGWAERVEQIQEVPEVLDKVARAYSNWLEDNPDSSLDEKMLWLGRFAKGGNVEPLQLAKKVGLDEVQTLA